MLREVQQRLVERRSSRTFVDSSRFKTSIMAIADLLNSFHGNGDSYEVWENQVRLLRTMYELDENEAKILIGKSLKEKTSEWFQTGVFEHRLGGSLGTDKGNVFPSAKQSNIVKEIRGMILEEGRNF